MKIVFIGAGNVATHLGKKLVEVGEEVVQVFSRNMDNASELASQLNAAANADLDKVVSTADLYIIAVADNAIPEVLQRLEQVVLDGKLVVHTSGGTPSKVFEATPLLTRTGVFYPLQTFTKGRPIDFSEIPICIDATLPEDLQVLESLALKISDSVHCTTEKQRAWLHLSAVFVNNFTNHLFVVGEQLLEKQFLSFEMLLPLIYETVEKLEGGSPKAMQTGPAIRQDWKTTERHLTMMNHRKDLQEIYRNITKNIKKAHADNRPH